MSKEITLVEGDDWSGLYVDGKLVAEGHSFSNSELLEYCGVKHNRGFADLDWLADRGTLPKKLSDVKWKET